MLPASSACLSVPLPAVGHITSALLCHRGHVWEDLCAGTHMLHICCTDRADDKCPASFIVLYVMPDGTCVGREDIDALMLGTGRPFIAEILNARSAMLHLEHFQRLQQQLLEVLNPSRSHSNASGIFGLSHHEMWKWLVVLAKCMLKYYSVS